MATIFDIKNGAVKIQIYPADHNPPHCHVVGRGWEFRVNLNTLKPLKPAPKVKVPRSDFELVMNKIKLEQDYLLEQWEEMHEKK